MWVILPLSLSSAHFNWITAPTSEARCCSCKSRSGSSWGRIGSTEAKTQYWRWLIYDAHLQERSQTGSGLLMVSPQALCSFYECFRPNLNERRFHLVILKSVMRAFWTVCPLIHIKRVYIGVVLIICVYNHHLRWALAEHAGQSLSICGAEGIQFAIIPVLF